MTLKGTSLTCIAGLTQGHLSHLVDIDCVCVHVTVFILLYFMSFISKTGGRKLKQDGSCVPELAQRCKLKIYLSRSSKVISQGHNRKRVYGFLLDVNSNLSRWRRSWVTKVRGGVPGENSVAPRKRSGAAPLV